MNNVLIFFCGLIIVSIAIVPIILSVLSVEDPWEKEQKLKEKMKKIDVDLRVNEDFELLKKDYV